MLGREPTPAFFESQEIEQLAEERILITGAGGSIGSRIVKLIDSIPGTTFLATDRDESALHSLSLSLTTSALFDSPNFKLLDVRDIDGIRNCISEFEPTVVIHAAALKHLSVLQKQPREAVLSNILGSADLLKIASQYGVARFVNISTDKAANPSSILGITKHLAELCTAKYRFESGLLYTNCRFGNVFNSRGSVIETFIRQMQVGAPITLTHPEITRYFMHTDEAAFLTLKSLLINNGDVHIFDMGDPFSMYQIIQRMQEILKSSSQILITGLREGEKLHEILYEDESNLKLSTHPKIKVLTFSDQDWARHISIFDSIGNRQEEKITKYLSSVYGLS